MDTPVRLQFQFLLTQAKSIGDISINRRWAGTVFIFFFLLNNSPVFGAPTQHAPTGKARSLIKIQSKYNLFITDEANSSQIAYSRRGHRCANILAHWSQWAFLSFQLFRSFWLFLSFQVSCRPAILSGLSRPLQSKIEKGDAHRTNRLAVPTVLEIAN